MRGAGHRVDSLQSDRDEAGPCAGVPRCLPAGSFLQARPAFVHSAFRYSFSLVVERIEA
jgi:hypothetical protein